MGSEVRFGIFFELLRLLLVIWLLYVFFRLVVEFLECRWCYENEEDLFEMFVEWGIFEVLLLFVFDVFLKSILEFCIFILLFSLCVRLVCICFKMFFNDCIFFSMVLVLKLFILVSFSNVVVRRL